jgi:hypothetical protein
MRGAQLLVTAHPSSLLRVPEKYKAGAYRRLVDDLKVAARFQQSEH